MQTNVFNNPNFVDPDPIHPTTTSLCVKEDGNYKLEKVVVLSRHNIRSPMTNKESILSMATPYDWYSWTSAPSELSLRGKELEIKFGYYFREYLISKNLFNKDILENKNKIRIYANNKQRTIASAQCFAKGLLNDDTNVEYHCELNKLDPVFAPILSFTSDAFNKFALSQIEAYGGEKGLEGICEKLSDNYGVLKEVLDFYCSDYYKTHGDFRLDDTKIVLKKNYEPYIEGTLGSALCLSDALTLQLYEEQDKTKASFGDTVSKDEWTKIAEIVDVGVSIMFGYSKAISLNVCHNMLKEINEELNNNRILTFLFGHDSNIVSVLSAIGVDDYYLPHAISRKTPVGCKLMIEKWINNNIEYATVSIVYQSLKQIRHIMTLDLDNPPIKYYLKLNNINANEDGYYLYKDVIDLFTKAINDFDSLPR